MTPICSAKLTLFLISFFSLLLYHVSAASTARRQTSAISTIYQFPNQLENIAVRPNGNLLISYITAPELYEINPSANVGRPSIAHTFPNGHSVFGIQEISPDVFAVATGIIDQLTLQAEREYTVWRVDMTADGATTEIAKVPDAEFLNGLTVIPSSEAATTVLVADSFAGCVWAVDIATGAVTKSIDDESMKVRGGAIPISVNGVLARGGTLYYTNMGQRNFLSIPLNDDGTAAGNATVIASDIGGDDFEIDAVGTAYITTYTDNTLFRVSAAGELMTSILDFQLNGLTAAHFGRTADDERTLYVVTNEGRVVAVQVDLVDV
ncbi:hypothetical protein AJ79_08446 [Helicocarpus griseus UAMH5409]|uniref:SMP-30/Gluconolactonase/LRE-like region domain-containing protein n=1 Tax=Helicocarpus griseus UAMH5409 TaxID=1447875 RepID=A0A2B7WST3_9EURO|nr:hypothetical protein AJ79_08446 [Helicocarpus griseus UAMH5409]